MISFLEPICGVRDVRRQSACHTEDQILLTTEL